MYYLQEIQTQSTEYSDFCSVDVFRIPMYAFSPHKAGLKYVVVTGVSRSVIDSIRERREERRGQDGVQRPTYSSYIRPFTDPKSHHFILDIHIHIHIYIFFNYFIYLYIYIYI